MSELTPDQLKSLSPRAAKLLWAYEIEPGATDARYADLAGCKPRWLKHVRQELIAAGLLEVRQDESTLTPEQDTARMALTRLGVERQTAQHLAQTCSPDLIHTSVQYVRGRRDISNQAGYVVKQLRAKLKEQVIRQAKPTERPGRDAVQQGEGPMPQAAAGGNVNRAGSMALKPAATQVSVVPNETNSPGLYFPRLPFARQALDTIPGDVVWQLLLNGLCAITGVDPLLYPEILDYTEAFYQRGCRVEHLQTFVKEVWPGLVARGRRGEMPTLLDVREYLGRVRPAAQWSSGGSYLARPAVESVNVPGQEEDQSVDDQLAASLARFEALEAKRCAQCGHLVCQCRAIAIPAYIRDVWLSVLGQLKIQLKRSTYESWLRDTHLAAFEDNQVKVEVPHPYVKDWIERHLLASMMRAFNDIYCYRGRPPVQIVVEIASGDD